MSWLIGWNKEFRCASNCFFMPESTQQAIWAFPKKQPLLEWLGNEVHVSTLNVYNFARLLCTSLLLRIAGLLLHMLTSYVNLFQEAI